MYPEGVFFFYLFICLFVAELLWLRSSVGLVAPCGWGSASPPPLRLVGVGVMHGYMWPQGRVATARFPEIDKSNVPQPHYLLFTASITGPCSLSGQDEVFCSWHKNVFIHRTRVTLCVYGQLNLKPMPKFPPLALLPLGVQNQVFHPFGLVGPSHCPRQVRNTFIGGQHKRRHKLSLEKGLLPYQPLVLPLSSHEGIKNESLSPARSSTAGTRHEANVRKKLVVRGRRKGSTGEVLVSISQPLSHQKNRGRPARAPCQRRHLARATTAPSKCLQLFDITCEDHVGILRQSLPLSPSPGDLSPSATSCTPR